MSTTTLTYRCPHCGTPVTAGPREGNAVLTCPAEECRKPFRIDVPAAKPVSSATLPVDKGENLVEQPPPRAENAAEQEVQFQTVQPDMLRRYPLRCLGHALLVLASLGSIAYGVVQGWLWLQLTGLVLTVLALFRLLVWWLRMRSTTLKLTNQRCILECGVFSKQATELRLADITDIQVRQGLLTRMLNVGDLVISSNHGEKKRVIVMAVPDPENVACRLRNGR